VTLVLETALQYRERWSVIPVERKRPLIEWTEFQKRRPEASELRDWWAHWPSAGIAIITGAVSDLTVIDLDNKSPSEFQRARDRVLALIPEGLLCPTVGTPSGGRHLYFLYAPGIGNRARVGGLPIDVRGEGGYVVCPPSPGYIWTLEDEDLVSMPPALRDFISERTEGKPPALRVLTTGSRVGSRNNDLHRVAYKLLADGTTLEATRAFLYTANEKFSPPLDSAELETLFASAVRAAPVPVPGNGAHQACPLDDIPPPGDDDLPLEPPIEPDSEPRPSSPIPPFAAAAASEDWAVPLPPTIPTALRPLDIALRGGLRAESIYVLIGKTGGGKSALACQLAVGISRKRPVLYASTELGRRQVLARLAAHVLGDDWLDLWELADGSRIIEALADMRVRVVAMSRDTQLCDILARVADADGEPPVLVLDYLQDLSRRMGTPDDDRRLAVAGTSDEIREWARSTRSAAILISSTTRAHYHADGSDPMECLAAAKESGDVEQDATGTICMHSDGEPVEGGLSTRVVLAKHRFGLAPKIIGLRYLGGRGLFVEDQGASLLATEREVLQAIRDGADSVDGVRAMLHCRKNTACKVVDSLVRKGLVLRDPLRENP